MTTYTYRGYKASADYTCPCSICGKTLKRKAVVEHTVNPFNRNDAGEVKTASEVRADAYAAAKTMAANLQDKPQICRDCDDAPNRALLLEMGADPNRTFPAPATYWSSPMHVLVDRKQVEQVHQRCECGSDCCSGWKNNFGYRLTKLGRERAKSLARREEAAHAQRVAA